MNEKITIAMILDLKPFITEMEKSGKISQEFVTKMKTTFNQLPDKPVGDFSKNLSGMNMAIGQFGWVLGDANMFMVNFRMGMMSIANNIPMVIMYMQTAKTEAAALGITFRQALAQSIMGPGGVLLAVNALMFAIQLFSMQPMRDEADKTRDRLKGVRDEFEKLTREQLQSQLLISVMYYRQKYGQMIQFPLKEGGTTRNRYIAEFTVNPDAKKQQAFIESLEDQLFMLGDIENVERRLSINKQKQKDLNVENYKTLVAGANSLDNAKDIINKWIESDQKLLKTTSGRTANYEKTRKESDAIVANEIELERILREAINTPIIEQKKVNPEDFLNEEKRKFESGFGYSSREYIRGNQIENSEYNSPENIKKRWMEMHTIEMAGVESLKPGISAFIDEFLNGTGRMDKAWKGLWDNAKQHFYQRITEMISSGLVDALINQLAGIGGAGAGKTGGGDILGGGFGLLNIVTSIFGLASGAVVTKPTLAMVGEGNEAEGVFPLSYLNNYMNNYASPTHVHVSVSGRSRIEGRALVEVYNLEKKIMEDFG